MTQRLTPIHSGKSPQREATREVPEPHGKGLSLADPGLRIGETSDRGRQIVWVSTVENATFTFDFPLRLWLAKPFGFAMGGEENATEATAD
jgi:hypothetical protein